VQCADADNNIFANITLDPTFLKKHAELMQPTEESSSPLPKNKIAPPIKIIPVRNKETKITKPIKKVFKKNLRVNLPNEEKRKQFIEWLWQDFQKNFYALTPKESDMIFIKPDDLPH
jgi:hypothetical protein